MKKNICMPDYDRSILSISSSLMKHYNVNGNYKSLEELDKILDKNYKNVIFLILDCLGMEILKNNLPENSILRKNVVTSVTTVFPPTTAAATTAFHSGLSPKETGWVGWMPYFKDANCMIELFTGKDFYTREKVLSNVWRKDLEYKEIYERICDKNKNIKYHKVFPAKVVPDGAQSFSELCENIKKSCNNNDKNLVSAYWTDPDHTIHHNGANSKAVKDVLKDIDDNLEKLVKELDDSVIVISADHGAVDVKEIYLNEIKEIDECLRRYPSIESRFVSFFIKRGMKNKFKKALEKHLKDEYVIYTKNEFLKKELLGRGKAHKRMDEYLGDYIVIVTGNYNIRYSITGERDKEHYADHGGITEAEMIVPLIVLETKK